MAEQGALMGEKLPDAAAAIASEVGAAEGSRKDQLKLWFARSAAHQPRILWVAWIVVALVWIASLVLAYGAWILGFSALWGWMKTGGTLAWAGGALGSLLLFCVPIWGWMAALGFTHFVADCMLAQENDSVAVARERVRETEEDALNRLESTDQAGLLPLLRYSRAQLDAYYAMGLAQTRRSFINAVTAMWLGFLLLIVGVALYVAPVERLGLPHPTADFKTLILASAAIIEFIAALFLWVYRSTIGQLTFYYRLQMHSHTAILCFRIATTMDQADETKRAIIDKVLGSSMVPERPAMVTSKGLASLIGKGG
jgi:hypothetical protein